MTLKIHSIRHANFEGLGAMETWAKQKGHELRTTHPYRGEKLPENMNDFDLLVLMGGPQNAGEVDKYSYLADEMALVRQAVAADKVILGICLGAQIIGQALGGQTLRSPEREIGDYSVQLLPESKNDPFFSTLPAEFIAMHWHNDMPGIPEGAVLLAKSAGCSHQAFRYGKKVYGLQFHLELTKNAVEALIQNCPEDLPAGTYVKSIQQLREINYPAINELLYQFLDYLERLVG